MLKVTSLKRDHIDGLVETTNFCMLQIFNKCTNLKPNNCKLISLLFFEDNQVSCHKKNIDIKIY